MKATGIQIDLKAIDLKFSLKKTKVKLSFDFGSTRDTPILLMKWQDLHLRPPDPM